MGAALRGLGGVRPSMKKCRRHYGFQLDLPYDPDFDDERHVYKSKFDRSKRARGTMIWKIKMVSISDNGEMVPKLIMLAQGFFYNRGHFHQSGCPETVVQRRNARVYFGSVL